MSDKGNLEKEFKDAITAKTYAKIAEKRILTNNYIENYDLISSVDKKLVSAWLARGKSFEEAVDPKNTISLLLTVLVTILVFVLKDVILVSFNSTFISIIVVGLVGLFLAYLFLLIGNTIGRKNKISALNQALTSILNSKE